MTKLRLVGRLEAWSVLAGLTLCVTDTTTTAGLTRRGPLGGGEPVVEQHRRPPQAVMPATLKVAVARSRQKAPGYDFAVNVGGTLTARAGDAGARTAVVATGRGVRLDGTGGVELGVETRTVGRDGAHRASDVVREHAAGQDLVLERQGDVEERLLAGPLGVEQTFEMRSRPPGDGPLAIEVAFEGLVPVAQSKADQVVLRDGQGRVRAGYRDLVAVDAEGRELASRMEVRGTVVALVIEDAKAEYPVRVDPLVWVQTAELTASDGAEGDGFGYSVAVDGTTAIVGAPRHAATTTEAQGAAYVYVQNGTTWAQQAELAVSHAADHEDYGSSVALSGDTAIVGAPGSLSYVYDTWAGAAYVFVRSGTTWTQRAELTGSGGDATCLSFGSSVALSGNTAIVGASGSDVGNSILQGAAYIFVQDGTGWSQQAALTASDGASDDFFGISVGLSGDTAIVGAWNHTVGSNAQQGAAYIFARGGTGWTQQVELTASDGAANDSFGISVAVSDATAVVGARAHAVGTNAAEGAAYIFAQNGTTWTQQAEVTPGDGAANDSFGNDVAVSDGTVMVGAPGHEVGATDGQGASYIFVQSGTTWTQEAELTASDGASGDCFGCLVALSGGVAFVGAWSHTVGTNTQQGAAYVFEQEECDAGICAPVPDAGSDGSVTPDAGTPLEAGPDSGVPRDAARDSGAPHDAAIDSRTPPDATRDSTIPPDAARDSGTTRDATGPHDASTDATKRAKDASLNANAGRYVNGRVGCGCRTARGSETGASPAWLAFGAMTLLGRLRRRRKR